jgi:hypothetical protein
MCRILSVVEASDELNNLIRNTDTVNYIKTQRLRWLGHINRMTNDKIVYEWEPTSKTLAGNQTLDGNTM